MSNQQSRVTISAEEYARLKSAEAAMAAATAAPVQEAVDAAASAATETAAPAAVPVPAKKRGWLFYTGATAAAAAVAGAGYMAYQKFMPAQAPVPDPEEVGNALSAFFNN